MTSICSGITVVGKGESPHSIEFEVALINETFYREKAISYMDSNFVSEKVMFVYSVSE